MYKHVCVLICVEVLAHFHSTVPGVCLYSIVIIVSGYTSENDPHSYLTEAVTNKAQKKIPSLQRNSNLWPLRHWCNAQLPTELWSLIGSRSSASSIALITVEPAVQRFACESAWKWGVWVMINSESSEIKQIVRGNIPPNAYFFWKRACSNVQWCLPSPNKVLDKD